MNRQKRTLFILFAVLTLSLAYAFWRTPSQERVGTATSPRVSSKSKAITQGTAAPSSDFRVHLELLERKEEEFPGAKRDIFGPLYTVKPPPPPNHPKLFFPLLPKGRGACGGDGNRAPAVGSLYLSRFFEKDQEKTIFLSSDDDIFVVKKGERLGPKNEYLVTELTPEMLVLQLRDDPRKITVPLVEQAPLSPSTMRIPSLPESVQPQTQRRSAPGGFVRRYPGRAMPEPPPPVSDLVPDIEPAEVLPDLQQPVTGDEEPPAEEVIQ